jgi:N-acetylmuramoyl-L-alanine amidase
MRPVSEIIVHCTATQANWMANRTLAAKIAEIKLWHKARGFSDIGYHFLIDRDGTLSAGRPLETVGAHVQGHNTGTIGISLLGGHGSSADDRFDDNFTMEQDKALRELIGSLKARFPTIRKVSGHNEYAAKACPGFRVAGWLGSGASAPSSKPVGGGKLADPVVKAPKTGLFAVISAFFAAFFRKGR